MHQFQIFYKALKISVYQLLYHSVLVNRYSLPLTNTIYKSDELN